MPEERKRMPGERTLALISGAMGGGFATWLLGYETPAAVLFGALLGVALLAIYAFRG